MISVKEKVAYGLGDTASNFVFQTVILFLTFYYTDVVGLNPVTVGSIFLLVRLIDAVTDPLMGSLADKTRTRWGAYRPYLLWMALPFALISVIAFTTPDTDYNGKLIYAIASYVDIHGISKGKFVPVAHLGQMMEGSELYTGAALDGVPQDINDDEVAAMPDPATATPCTWNPELVWFASDLHLNGEPFQACSRHILKRQLAAAAELGFSFNLGIETEFFLFKDTEDGGFAPISDRDVLDKPCYDPSVLMDNLPIIDEIVEAMNEQGWDVYSFDHEDANGQFETDFMFTDALNMADRLVYFRMMANEIARKHGAFASFMPKPYSDKTGSGAHYNMSLADAETGENLFSPEKGDPYGCGVSELGYQFIAGVLKHARAISAVIAPTVNSYKRLVRQGSMSGSTWAPVFACYGNNNRTNMIRIPGVGSRVECRAADIACNPYLGAALVLAAGLEGIEDALDAGRGAAAERRVGGDARGRLVAEQRQRAGREPVPGDRRADAERVGRARGDVEVEAGAEVADAGPVERRRRDRARPVAPLVGGHLDVEAVVAGRQRERAEHARREHAGGADGARQRAPVERAARHVLDARRRAVAAGAGHLGVDGGEPERVAAAVDAQVDAVAVGRSPAQLGVEVVEREAGVERGVVARHRVLVGAVDEGSREQVDVRPPPRDQQRRPAGNDRSFRQDRRREQPDLPAHAPPLEVAVAQAHVQHRRQPPAEARRVGALRQLHPADGVRVERREEAEQVGGVVERCAVEQHECLVGRAAADVEPRRPLLPRADARQQLDRLQHVGLAEQRGERLHVAPRQRDRAHLGRLLGPRRARPVRLDHHLACGIAAFAPDAMQRGHVAFGQGDARHGFEIFAQCFHGSVRYSQSPAASIFAIASAASEAAAAASDAAALDPDALPAISAWTCSE